MKKYKYLRVGFGILAVLLSDAMCAVVAYTFCDMVWSIRYAGFSAPADVAFFLAIPFLFGIAVCLFLMWLLRRIERKAQAK